MPFSQDMTKFLLGKLMTPLAKSAQPKLMFSPCMRGSVQLATSPVISS